MRGRFGVGLAGSAVLVGALALMVGTSGPPQGDDGQGVVTEPGAQSAVQQDPGGTSEGIKVHGHWIIEIRNPDGSLVRRLEFDNDLMGGGYALAKVLARSERVGGWYIRLRGSYDFEPCLNQGTPSPCLVVESSFPNNNSTNAFRNLTVSAPTSGTNLGKLVLAGSATAQRDGDIVRVETNVQGCAGAVSVPECISRNQDWQRFTEKILSPGAAVLKDQSIMVTVVIDFS